MRYQSLLILRHNISPLLCEIFYNFTVQIDTDLALDSILQSYKDLLHSLSIHLKPPIELRPVDHDVKFRGQFILLHGDVDDILEVCVVLIASKTAH